MLLEYYGLNEQPFGVTPDPRFIYFGSKHREALASLVYGTESGRGFVALIAKPGMGKTSLLYEYLGRLRGKATTAFLFQTDCHRRELLRHILADLGCDATGKDLPAMHEMFNKFLAEEMRAGRRVILVIDEAQNLEEKALESIRLLSNFETPWMKLVQIVLAGQPRLAERLRTPSLAQLRQRISMIVRIEPFTPEEVGDYIRHRLWVAGNNGPSPFTVGAQAMIALHSEGIPRNINNICFNAMSLACALKRKTIDREIIREVLADLDLRSVNVGIPATAKTERTPERPAFGISQKAEERAPFHGWLPKVAVASALLLSLAVSWPLNRVSTTAQRAPVSSGSLRPGASFVASRAVPPLVEMKDAGFAADILAVSRQPGMGPADTKRNNTSERLRSITVNPGQTLYHIVIQHFGTYDDAILHDLRALNPWLVNPDQIQSGQLIILPSAKVTSASDISGVIASPNATSAARERP